jgi:predicted peptidase
MGGGITWEYAAANPKRFAAIVPICGASFPFDTRCKAIANADLPVWAFHNNDDATVAPSNSVNYVNKINSFNPSVAALLTLWPTGGHDAWTKATGPDYREGGKNMYEWMLQYSR